MSRHKEREAALEHQQRVYMKSLARSTEATIELTRALAKHREQLFRDEPVSKRDSDKRR